MPLGRRYWQPIPKPEVAKTHSGLITAFRPHLVTTGRISIEFGKALNRAAYIRLVSDYTTEQIAAEWAEWAISQAKRFVAEFDGSFPPHRIEVEPMALGLARHVKMPPIDSGAWVHPSSSSFVSL
ncbi:hypothetical protein [Methylocaldum szegediense]|jgi:hypothetical protein|uniref:Uncharacterized protein n=1 Tax=Methylocaldum szegediense TaxID=73780 RepID=A0ABM9I5E5_9GAMM|nr:hypothetical protein [Methylocaldum szegediense]CAI8903671.1 protein of unknown function [Methylocaldum szegediense]